MTAIYDVLVSDELLPDFHDGNDLMPAGFHVIEVLPWHDPVRHQTRVRVSDDDASPYFAGKVVEVSFTAHYDEAGKPIRVSISDRTVIEDFLP